MSSIYGQKPSLTPVTLSHRPSSVINNMNNNVVFQQLNPNSFKMNRRLEEFSKTNLIQNKTFYKEKNNDYHPLDFYTLGKIPSNTLYSNLIWNKGLKSTGSDIINRNALSINTKKFNQMNIHKRVANLYEQNITENNYLEPVKIFKTYEKYNLPKCATNKELYNIMKEKYFSRDIHSSISQGKCLSKKDFLKEKEKLMQKEKKVDNTNHNEDKGIKGKEKENKDLTKTQEIHYKKKEYSKSIPTKFEYKDPNDYSKKKLKSNSFYFDKNSNQDLKPKIWAYDKKE